AAYDLSRAPATPGGSAADWRTELGDLPDLDAIANLAPKRRRPEAEEATAPVAEDAEEGEEPLNRGLLLKFLSSVRN
ncbi:MAG TPA: hypothetical protein VEJ44_03785, partial [Acidimicrobiales bacterium]|nr:hypothetical protein [Acidimicrobiales bacterium]